MPIIDLLSNAVIAVLIGYLTFTNYLGNLVLNVLDTEQFSQEVSVTTKDENGVNIAPLPTQYEYGGTIPQILIENTHYQQAAVGAATASSSVPAYVANLSIEERIKASMVNIFCKHKIGDSIRTTTGTGFFVHENGVVLTNAHVAQFLLLSGIDSIDASACVLRGDDPAKPLYEAKLLYVPPTWINANASLINVKNPSGTGERDYALLYVSDVVGDQTMPDYFIHLPVDTSLLTRDALYSTVHVGGYPAQILFDEGPDVPLSPIVATTSVHDLYTFNTNYADIFSIGETPVGENGASGGPVLDEHGNAIGLIVTKGDESVDGMKSLRALTLSYINRTITQETGFTLEENMHGDLSHRGEIFKQALVPFLQHLLNQNLD